MGIKELENFHNDLCIKCSRLYKCALTNDHHIRDCPCLECLVKAMCSSTCKERVEYYCALTNIEEAKYYALDEKGNVKWD